MVNASSKSMNTYWTTRNEKAKIAKARKVAAAELLWQEKVSRNSVATVLPGCSIPAELAHLPVTIVQPNGAWLLCGYLV
jgi:hypothetical protein